MATPPPPKRRKTSPLPDAPRTPSRIPFLPFASPTKSSISRHYPQLLPGLASASRKAQKSGSRGSVQISGSPRRSARTPNNPTPVRKHLPSHGGTPSGLPRQSPESAAGGLLAKPRRRSQSPVKHFGNREVEKVLDAKLLAKGGTIEPFKKIGLRRSPVGSRSTQPLQEIADPFKKSGLRRSPTTSQASESQQENRHLEQPLESIPPTDSAVSEPNFQKVAIGRTPRFDDSAKQDVLDLDQPTGISNESEEVVPDSLEATLAKDIPSQNSAMPHPITSPSQGLQTRTAKSSRLSQGLEEPELPPTPVQKGIDDPIVTTPPTGIHNTPSKKAKRNKSLASKLKSSPLKPIDSPPIEPSPSEPPQMLAPIPETGLGKPLERRKSARLSIPVDPYADKKKLRDELQRELELIEADIALGIKENERLQSQQSSKGFKLTKSSDSDAVVAFLLRSTAPESPPKPKSHPNLLKSTISFLPFSANPKARSTFPSFDKPPPSHAPLESTDPLPYLQHFSSLDYTSNVTLLPSLALSDPDDSLTAVSMLQKYVITASHASGFFASRISMTVQPYTPDSIPSIQEIVIEALDSNAEPELGAFIRKQADLKAMPILGWAMCRWVEVSSQRAAFWCAAERDFGTAEARKSTVIKMRESRKGRGRRLPGEEGDASYQHEEEEMKEHWSRKQLLRHMGRTSMEIRDDSIQVDLRIEWRIVFDWTGEAESKISAGAMVPQGWQDRDDRRALPQIPELFDRMVKRRSPISALRTLVGLLMAGPS